MSSAFLRSLEIKFSLRFNKAEYNNLEFFYLYKESD